MTKLIIRIAVVLLVLITIIVAYIFVVVPSYHMSRSYQAIPTYYSKNYHLRCSSSQDPTTHCDTVYAIPDTSIVDIIPSVPYNARKHILEDSSVELPSIFAIEHMELLVYKKEQGKTILSSETFIWIDPIAHLAAYRTVTVDSVSRSELWSWQAWNVIMPDSVFALPSNMVISMKDKIYYDSLLPSEAKVIRK